MSKEEINRGFEAQRIMDDPLVKEALSQIESGLVEAMRMCPMADKDTQHELVLTLQLLDKFKGVFRELMETGKLAQMQEETLAAKITRRFRSF